MKLLNNIKFFNKIWWSDHKVSLNYTASSVCVSLAQLFSGILMVRWIIPEEMGLWHTVRLALTYSFFILAGVNNGLSRELPFYLGNDSKNKADDLASTALIYTKFGCLIMFVAGLLFIYNYRYKEKTLIFSIIAVIPLVLFSLYNNYLIVTFRSKDSFRNLTFVKFCEATIIMITIPLIFYFRYEGMLVRIVIITGFVLLLLHWIRPMKVIAKWDTSSFKILMKTGTPIFILDYLRTSACTFDRIALLKYGGIKDVGYYALAALALSTFSVIPTSLSAYVYPKMSYSLAKYNNPKLLWSMAWKNIALASAIMLPIAVFGWFLLPPVTRRFFPEYVPGIDAARIILFGALFTSGGIAAGAMWSMKAWRWMTIYQICFSISVILGPTIGGAICLSPITGVAYGMLCAYIISFVLSLTMTYLLTHQAIHYSEKVV
jgi:O-antigen/teichoic acid export membrane protein